MPAAMAQHSGHFEPLPDDPRIGRPRIGQYDINPFINSIYSKASTLKSGVFL